MLLLNLYIGHVLSWILANGTNLEEVLISSFVCALAIIFGVLSRQAHLGHVYVILLLHVVEHLNTSGVDTSFLVLNEISEVVHLLLVHHVLLLVLLSLSLLGFSVVLLGLELLLKLQVFIRYSIRLHLWIALAALAG